MGQAAVNLVKQNGTGLTFFDRARSAAGLPVRRTDREFVRFVLENVPFSRPDPTKHGQKREYATMYLNPSRFKQETQVKILQLLKRLEALPAGSAPRKYLGQDLIFLYKNALPRLNYLNTKCPEGVALAKPLYEAIKENIADISDRVAKAERQFGIARKSGLGVKRPVLSGYSAEYEGMKTQPQGPSISKKFSMIPEGFLSLVAAHNVPEELVPPKVRKVEPAENNWNGLVKIRGQVGFRAGSDIPKELLTSYQAAMLTK